MTNPTGNRFVQPTTLVGRHVTLEPLTTAHAPGLAEAVADGELWKLWYTAVPAPDTMESEIKRRLALQEQDLWQPFAVRCNNSGDVVGMTNFMNIDANNRRVEIGSTWYARRVQRGPLNTECKLMLLGYAFDKRHCIAVEFRTHWMNHQSRAAIARLGAKQDGVLRSHQRLPDGSLRDTVVFSIIASEWPMVRSHLQFQLARPR
nr:GNAT family protein [Cupriavidus pampae]